MVSGVLTLGERSIRSIMTPRAEISWINLEDDPETILQHLRKTPHSFFPVCRGQLDNTLGVARAKDLMADMMDGRDLDKLSSLREPILVHELTGVLNAMETLKRSRGQLVLVIDEYGTIQGLITPIDILEAIAGEFPDEDEHPSIQILEPGRWRVDGATDLHYLAQVVETDALLTEGDGFMSIAGLLLDRFGALPDIGAAIDLDDLRFEVVEITNRRIATIEVTRLNSQPPSTWRFSGP